MEYIVHSRGRPIGVTDFGFVRTGGPHRSGWFHPNDEGERVMPVISALHVAIRESARRFRRPRDAPASPPTAEDCELPADLVKALDDVEALALTLHRPDGSLIPTESVGIQDTEELLVTARMDESELGYDERFDESQLDEATREAIEHDLQILSEMEFEDDEPWRGEPEPTEWPRYQIHARVVNEWDVP